MSFENKHIFITGGNGGIGQEIVRQLHHKKAHITICGRNKNSLEALSKQYSVSYIIADITTTQGLESIKTYIENKPVDILINTAGILHLESFDDSDITHTDNTIATNLTAMIHLSHMVLPSMLQKKTPCQIVNIGSVADLMGMPYFTVYCATKAGVKGFSESLNRELAGSNITVCYIAPKAVSTPMNTETMQGVLKSMYVSTVSAPLVAETIISSIEKRKKRTFIGWFETFGGIINTVAPWSVDIVFRLLRNRVKRAILSLDTSSADTSSANTSKNAEK